MEILKFTKVRDVKSPTRGTSLASGIDMFVPTFDEQFLDDLDEKNPGLGTPGHYGYVVSLDKKCIFLAPHHRIVIPSGIKLLGVPGYSYNMHNKSGVATKKGLIFGAEVCDADYQGEVHLSIINTSPNIVEICEGEKLLQILIEPVVLCPLEEVATAEELYAESESVRGEGWQGSTGTK